MSRVCLCVCARARLCTFFLFFFSFSHLDSNEEHLIAIFFFWMDNNNNKTKHVDLWIKITRWFIIENREFVFVCKKIVFSCRVLFSSRVKYLAKMCRSEFLLFSKPVSPSIRTYCGNRRSASDSWRWCPCCPARFLEHPDCRAVLSNVQRPVEGLCQILPRSRPVLSLPPYEHSRSTHDGLKEKTF